MKILFDIQDRNELAVLFGRLSYKIGAEIGVKRGAYSECLVKTIPSLTLYSIDPWIAYSGSQQVSQDRYYARAVKRLTAYNVKILKKTSMEALNNIQDNGLDFVYIDALHDFDNVYADIIGWTKKVRIGGIVAGHDYTYPNGVTQAVDKYVEENIVALNITKEGQLPSAKADGLQLPLRRPR